MKSLPWFVFALCMVCSSITLRGQDDTTESPQPASQEDLASRMKGLMASLDGDTLAERDQAAKDILEIGLDAIPFLEKAGNNISGEMQARIQALLEKLRSSEIVSYIKPSLVTLKGNFTVRDALDAVTKQTENKFRIEMVPETTIDLDLEDVSFWEAVDEILDAAGLDVESFGNSKKGLPLKPRAATTSMRILRASYTDAFRIEPIEVRANRSLNDPSQNTLTIKTWVAWEPRMTPVFLQFPMKNLEVTLSDGTVLSATTPDAAPEYSPEPDSYQVEVEFTTKLPARNIEKITGIKGSFFTALPGKKVKLIFNELDKPGKKTQTAGNLTVIVDRVRKNNRAYELSSQVKLSNAKQTMDSFRGWLTNNEGYILDEKDRRLENVGLQSSQNGRSGVEYKYFFDMNKGPDKYRFVFEAPGAVNEQTFDFELSEVELP